MFSLQVFNMALRLKKTASAVVVTIVLFSLVFSPMLNSLSIVFATAPPPGISEGIEDPVAVPTKDRVGNKISFFQLVKEYILDALVYYLNNKVIEELTKSVVNWINSGFEGNPSFAINLDDLVNTIADQVLGDLIQGSDLGFLCAPFKVQIQRALVLQNRRSGQFRKKIQCTLSGVVGNLEKFAEGDFTQGGWTGWLELSKKQNNVYGAYIQANEEYHSRLLDKLNQQLKKLDWGNGFLSFERCVLVPVPDEAGGGPPQQRCEVTTPGAVIEEQLNNNLDSGRQRITVADEVDEILGAALSQLVKQALTAGLRSVNTSGLGLDEQPDFGFPDINPTSPTNPSSTPTVLPDGPGGISFPPNAGSPATESVVFGQPGEFFTSTAARTSSFVEIPVEEGKYYKRLTVDFDVFVDTLRGPLYNGPLVEFVRNGLRGYASVFINKRDRATTIEKVNATHFDSPANWQEKTRYHVRFHYDAELNRMTFDVRNQLTGENIQQAATSVINRNIASEGGALKLNFGMPSSANDGTHAAPSAGWIYSDLNVVLE